MDYTNQLCPVCNQKFTPDDDIVVCPECGTPHHRDCYLKNGRCAKAELHSAGYGFVPVVTWDGKSGEDDTKNAADNMTHPAENPFEWADEPYFAGPQEQPFSDVFGDLRGKTPDEILIGGVPASYYEAAIGKNTNYYIPRFLVQERAGKKAVWNFFAFLCPFAWAFYRKLYGFAAIVLVLLLGMTFASNSVYLADEAFTSAVKECVEEAPSFITKISSYQSGVEVELTAKQVALIEALNKVNYPKGLSIAFWLAEISICTVFGLFGTKWYRESLAKKIAKGMALNMEPEKTKAYLSRKGGTAPIVLAAIFAFFEITRYL